MFSSVVTVWVSVLLAPLPGVTVFQWLHEPPRCLYSHLVTVDPEGAFQLRDARALPPVAARSVGAPGTATGVTDTGSDPAPLPAALTARTLKMYAVPLVRPVTLYMTRVAGRHGDAQVMAVQSPLSCLYCQDVMDRLAG